VDQPLQRVALQHAQPNTSQRPLPLELGHRLPFEPNHAVRVIQGYDGGISHTGPMRHALDFDLPEGSLVRAARDGVVADAIHTFKTAGTDKSYREQDKANRVLVRHADGTFGYYGHLKPGGVFVREGQSVR
jgi:murein DD-endopeptidase MepM/ murein hydrolase activator NlpD